MALDYSPNLERHDTQRKVGVITRAEIVGKALELDGYLFAKDFPEVVREIERSRRPSVNAAASSYVHPELGCVEVHAPQHPRG
jgi:hypothetical protein